MCSMHAFDTLANLFFHQCFDPLLVSQGGFLNCVFLQFQKKQDDLCLFLTPRGWATLEFGSIFRGHLVMSDDFDDQLGPSGLIQACHEGFDKVAMWLVLTKGPKGNSGSKTRKSKEPNGLVRTICI